MAGQVTKVMREVLEACMTCPICHKLLMEATTISLCLHTFCRKCIYEKLSDEEVDCCPVCNIDLGCLPVEKLRPDHNLQDIRAKIFPFKRRKVEAPQVTPSVVLPAKRKERSLSSLVVSTPKVPLQSGLTGRRSKSGSRKAAASRGSVAAELTLKEDSPEDGPPSTSSLESHKSLQTKRQDSEPSNDHKFKEDVDNDAEATEGKADLWTPLNCLVEAANRTKSSKSNFQGLSLCKSESNSEFEPHSPEIKSKAEPSNGINGEVYTRKTKNKNQTLDLKDQGDKNASNSHLTSAKRRRLPPARKKADMADDGNLSAQMTVDTCRDGNLRKSNPIWFSLVPSEDKKEVVNLPQISACYLRIKDGKMPVSFILKYLTKKLDLDSESEVSTSCSLFWKMRFWKLGPTRFMHILFRENRFIFVIGSFLVQSDHIVLNFLLFYNFSAPRSTQKYMSLTRYCFKIVKHLRLSHLTGSALGE